ncbi:MAG: HD-GYP domain-containing protein [Brevinematia bacterium]
MEGKIDNTTSNNIEINSSESSDEILVPIKISKYLLKEGDILNEDLLYYDNLKRGLKLTKEIIKVLQDIDLLKDVSILRSKKIIELEEKGTKSSIEIEQVEEEKTKTIEEIKETDIKLGFNDEKVDKIIAHSIKATFDKLRGEDFEEKVENTKQEIQNKIIQDEKLSLTAKAEIEESIREISQCFVETFALQKVVPISNKVEVTKLNFSNKSISNYFLELVITDKVSFVNSAKSVVTKFINSFGDDNGGIVLSSLFQYSENDDYVVSHSMFIMAISILIAKELTKLVYEKILSSNQEKIDPKTLKIISMKTFDFEDLVNLGIASILHDTGIKKNFGSIPASFKIPSKTSKIELHPSESSFFVQRLSLDITIQRAVYEHHEFLDGTGYPKGVTKYMSKYSPILAFAERFSELVLENPFINNPIPPALAINYILKNEIKKFDKDVIYAFIRGTSTFPIGSWVELSNETIGFVSNISKKDKTKQIVKVVFAKNLQKLQNPREIDLAEEDVKIIRVINPIDLQRKVGDLKQYYFS